MGTKAMKIKINKDFTELAKAFNPIDRLYNKFICTRHRCPQLRLMKCIITVLNV